MLSYEITPNTGALCISTGDDAPVVLVTRPSKTSVPEVTRLPEFYVILGRRGADLVSYTGPPSFIARSLIIDRLVNTCAVAWHLEVEWQ